MSRSVYIICAKCGSDCIIFERDLEGGDVHLSCDDCATLTWTDEHNEWVYEEHPHLKKKVSEVSRDVE